MNKPNKRFQLPLQKLSWWADKKIQLRLKAAARAQSNQRSWHVAPYAMALTCMLVGVLGYQWWTAPAQEFMDSEPLAPKEKSFDDGALEAALPEMAYRSMPLEDKAEFYPAQKSSLASGMLEEDEAFLADMMVTTSMLAPDNPEVFTPDLQLITLKDLPNMDQLLGMFVFYNQDPIEKYFTVPESADVLLQNIVAYVQNELGLNYEADEIESLLVVEE